MTFLPIVARELRVQARRPATQWVRFGTALSVLLLWLVVAAGSQRLSTPELSHNLFMAVGVLALGFSLLAGVFLTADCLSEEKREGTLGLLFLTDLKGYDVVLGKLTVSSLHSVYCLLAVFPVLGLPLLMGGVTGGEFWRVVLALLAALQLSLTMGLFVSSLNRDARQAMAGTFFGMLLLGGLLPAIWWLGFVFFRSSWPDFLLWPSPAEVFRTALANSYALPSGRHEFWAALNTVLFLGFGFLVFAAVFLPRTCGEERLASPAPENPISNPYQAGVALYRRALRAYRLELNPFFWLASRDQLSRNLTWGLIGALTVLWFCFYAASLVSTRHKEAFIVCLFVSYALHQIFKCMFAIEATRQLNIDRVSGALELLLVTPLAEHQILEGQRSALRENFRPLVLLLVIINLCMCLATLLWPRSISMSKDDQAIFFELFLGGLLMIFLDTMALAEVGMLMALRARRHHRAVLATLGRVLLPPWVAVFMLVFVMQAVVSTPQSAFVTFGFWFLFGIFIDFLMFGMAKADLAHGIRRCLVETKPFLEIPPVAVPRLAPASA